MIKIKGEPLQRTLLSSLHAADLPMLCHFGARARRAFQGFHTYREYGWEDVNMNLVKVVQPT